MDNKKNEAYNYFKTQMKWIDDKEINIDYLIIIFHDFCKYNNLDCHIDDIV